MNREPPTTGEGVRGASAPTERPSGTPVRASEGLKRFLLFLAAYAIFFGGRPVMGDNVYRIAWAKTLLEDGGHDISRVLGAEDPMYCKYPLASTLVQVPFLAAAKVVRKGTGVDVRGPALMSLFLLNAALGLTFVHSLLRSYGQSRAEALWHSLAIGFTTVWFPYSKTDYMDSLVATCLLGMWAFSEKRAALAGLFGGLAMSLRPEGFLWAGLTAAFLPGRKKHWKRWAAGGAPFLLLIVLDQWIRAGFEPGVGARYESHWLSNPIYEGLYGMVLSSGKSVFLFSPLLCLYGFAVRSLLRREDLRRFGGWTLCLLSSQLAFFSQFWFWAGDLAWGARYLAPAVLPCLAVVALAYRKFPRWYCALAVCGLAVQGPSVLIGPHTAVNLAAQGRPMIQDREGRTRRLEVADWRYNPRHSQILASVELSLFKLTGWVRHETPNEFRASGYLESFEPPLARDEIPWDLFWLRPFAATRDSGSEPRNE